MILQRKILCRGVWGKIEARNDRKGEGVGAKGKIKLTFRAQNYRLAGDGGNESRNDRKDEKAGKRREKSRKKR